MDKRIGQIIDDLKISKAEFAKEIDVQRSSISHITSGRNKPSLDIVLKILERYPQYSTDWLLFGSGKKFNQTEDHIINEKHTLPDKKDVTKITTSEKPESQNVYNTNTKNNVDKSKQTSDDLHNETQTVNVNKSTQVNQTIFSNGIAPEQVLVLFDDSTFKTYKKRD